jgi:dipeptidyl-peptidase-4
MFVVVTLSLLGIPVRSHAIQPPNWQSTAAGRLKSIYENRDFRADRFHATWNRDGRSYTVKRRDKQDAPWVETIFDLRSGKSIDPSEVEESEKKPTDSAMSPDGSRRIEYRDHTIFIKDNSADRATRVELPPDGSAGQIHQGQAKWSPDGNAILFIATNDSDVKTRAVLVPTDPSYPEIDHHRFARVGETIESLRVGIVDADGKNLFWLPFNRPDEGFYLGMVEWAGNSDEVIVEKMSRFRNQRELLLVNRRGIIKTLFEESRDSWVVDSRGKNLGLIWIRDGQAFIVLSDKDGWQHAYVYSRQGDEIGRLTHGEFDVIERSEVDERNGWFYFYASPNNGTQKHLFRVPLDGTGTLEQISPEVQPGTHHYEFSPDKHWAIHKYSRLDVPPVFEIVEIPSGRVMHTLEFFPELKEALAKVQVSPTEFLKLDIGNGVVMDAWLVKPKDFDPGKKYPIFVYVYGEPHAQTVLDEWGAAQIDFNRAVAELGYIVVSIDNRGTPCPKGVAWRHAIFGSLGPLSTEEQAAGVRELARTRSYVDLERVAIWGWSGGGSNTLNALFRQPDLYKVGIAVVPKPQPHLYNAWFQEIYMQDRSVNPEGYARSAPLNFAEGLRGNLLIVTGSGETNTHIQIIEGLVDRLIELGKPFDYMAYPNRDHGLREGPGSEVHVRMLIMRYLMEHLPNTATLSVGSVETR